MIANTREIFRDESDGEDEPNKKKEEKLDLKLPFDMKVFWKNVNEKYFKNLDQFAINEVNHLVHHLSKYDMNNDNIFTKIGFPKTLNCLVGKTQEIVSRKNNPLQVTKFFGMYMYIDKYDYLLNNLNNEEIEEEIDFSSNKLADIEESNHTFFKNLVAKVEAEKLANSKIDLQSESVYQNRYENLTAQIFTLQMKQFAESIWHIKRDPKKNKYVLIFDVSEAIEPLTLDEGAYKELIKYRDPMNSISVYDLFQEKIFSYYNTGSSPNKVTNKKGEGPKKRGRKPKKKTSDLKTDIVAKGQGKGPGRGKCRGRKSLVIKTGMKKFTTNSNVSPKKKQEEVEIAKVVNINYDFCHHCKQRKPAEVMVRCNSSHCHKYIEKPLKTFIVNNTTLVRKFKNFIITNYSGDPKDILDGYLNKKVQQHCKRSFCNFCIKGSYDQVIENIKAKKDWVCPWCLGNCFCSRCIRYDQILKLIALYISYNGDMNILYDNLIDKSSIFDKLSTHILISNVIIIKNDPVNKSNRLIQNYNGKKDYEALDNIIDTAYKYRDNLVHLKKHFDNSFMRAKNKKVTLNLYKKLTDACVKYYENKSTSFLGKKKKRDDKEDIDEIVNKFLNGSGSNPETIQNTCKGGRKAKNNSLNTPERKPKLGKKLTLKKGIKYVRLAKNIE